VQAKSKPGRGATFSVYLPATVGARETPDAALPQGRRGQGETVLLVDDEDAVLKVTQTTLERNGYRVLTARDGMQAVACFAQHSDEVKLVLTDVMMPFMDGVSLTRSLRSMSATVPVVAATGLSAAPGDVDRSANLRDLGVRHFLRKPFEADRLLEVLRTALEEARTEDGANR
jgi:CheY-like chemotaxis protein